MTEVPIVAALCAVALGACGRTTSDTRPASSGTPNANESSMSDTGDAETFANAPTNLEEAHARLMVMLPPDTIEKMRAGTEKEMVLWHHGLGTSLRNSWGLWGGSKLARYFNAMGVKHPDDMSAIILETFWCKLHDQPFRLEERIAGFQNYWAAMAKPKGVSPKDGAKIAWTMTKGPDNGGTVVHFGVSVSDGSYWRYEFSGGRGLGIEPARPEERAAIDDMVSGWKKTGRDASSFVDK